MQDAGVDGLQKTAMEVKELGAEAYMYTCYVSQEKGTGCHHRKSASHAPPCSINNVGLATERFVLQ